MKRHFQILCSLALGFFEFTAPSQAQTKAWNPTCAQILSMGWERYSTEHEKRSDDYSTAANVQRSARYIRCKSADNARRLQTLPAFRRARVQQVEKHLIALEDALWQMQMIPSGGTMLISFAAYGNAQRSDALGKMIVATQRAKRSMQARNNANNDWSVTKTNWQRIDERMKTVFEISPDLEKLRAKYQIARSVARRETGVLQVLATQLPDEAALILARRVETDVSNLTSPSY